MMRHATARGRAARGSSLVELLVALPIMGIVGTLAVMLLLAAGRQARRNDALNAAVRELRHAAVVAGAELRPLQPLDLIAWTDTSVEFEALVGTGIACGNRARTAWVDLMPPDEPHPTATRWIAPLQDGDRLTLHMGSGAPPEPPMVWQTFATGTTGGGACTPPLAPAVGVGTRVALDDSLPRGVAEGTPARITRRTRYHLYRAGDGQWYLGRNTRGRALWDVTQPVAGPFRSATGGGLRIRVVDSIGSALPAGPSAAAAAIRLELRAPRDAVAATSDSTFVAIAIRGRPDE